MILPFLIWRIRSRKVWHFREDTRFRGQLSEIKVIALSQAGCDFGASPWTFLNFCFLVYRIGTEVAARLWAPRRARLWSWGTHKIVYVRKKKRLYMWTHKSNVMYAYCYYHHYCNYYQLRFFFFFYQLRFSGETPPPPPPAEMFLLGLCALSAIVKIVTLSSLC